ncbi:MAG: hypothetical protein MZV49_26385 [Rhodopseudomonas palustris]|nr:hypothetical protein [Rhodopseudomonas palustris]
MHAGIIEPGHFRFTANGETVVRLEERLGYVHKGIDAPADRRRSLSVARSLPAASSGDSTVAYALAFARAAEAALGVDVPRARAVAARADGRAGAARQSPRRHRRHLQRRRLRADAGPLRRAARAACCAPRERAFGHRLMMDRRGAGRRCRAISTTPARRCDPADAPTVAAALSGADRTLRRHRLAAGPHRDAPGRCRPTLVAAVRRWRLCRPRLGARLRRARATSRYPPYDQLRFEVPVLSEGDVNARVWIRIREVEQSIGLIEQMLLATCRTAQCARAAAGQRERRRRRGAGRRVPRRRAGMAAARSRRG